MSSMTDATASEDSSPHLTSRDHDAEERVLRRLRKRMRKRMRDVDEDEVFKIFEGEEAAVYWYTEAMEAISQRDKLKRFLREGDVPVPSQPESWTKRWLGKVWGDRHLIVLSGCIAYLIATYCGG